MSLRLSAQPKANATHWAAHARRSHRKGPFGDLHGGDGVLGLRQRSVVQAPDFMEIAHEIQRGLLEAFFRDRRVGGAQALTQPGFCSGGGG